MKAVFVALALAAAAFAQNAEILAPAAGTSLSKSAPLTVSVKKQNSLTGSTDVSVAIGLQACSTGNCDDLPGQGMIGTVLYAGAFEPKPDAAGNVVQNFTVQVPDGVAEGAARLSVAHFYILGASNVATMDIAHSDVTITA
ncbi:hypothetical protein BD413DRAFT_613764 [Trametes elegans]|nr:hypothetical protein BD413DRAFT_613764 [Trametes elegans]